MAGDWIKMRCNLDSDPRVMRMAESLGVHELHIVGLLWKFWSWADAHTLDGNAASVTEKMVDRFTCDRFALQLCECGWLQASENGLKIPHFDEHNGQSAKARALTHARVKRHRNADTVTKPLLEKRREEKRRSNTNDPPPVAEAPKEEPKDPRHHEITSAWGNAIKRATGGDYAFSPRDAATLKRFLVGCKTDAVEILETAGKAWERNRVDRFAKACKHAGTIHGFCTFYNDISLELKSPLSQEAKAKVNQSHMDYSHDGGY